MMKCFARDRIGIRTTRNSQFFSLKQFLRQLRGWIKTSSPSSKLFSLFTASSNLKLDWISNRKNFKEKKMRKRNLSVWIPCVRTNLACFKGKRKVIVAGYRSGLKGCYGKRRNTFDTHRQKKKDYLIRNACLLQGGREREKRANVAVHRPEINFSYLARATSMLEMHFNSIPVECNLSS